MTCTKPDCFNPHKAKGLCSKHYSHEYKNGNIAKNNKPRHALTNINTETKTANCTICGPTKIRVHNHGKRKELKCVEVEKRSANKYAEKFKSKRLQQLKNKCEICGSGDRLQFDHDHNSGYYRGTLCFTCNLGLGCFKDNAKLTNKATEYLRRPVNKEGMHYKEVCLSYNTKVKQGKA